MTAQRAIKQRTDTKNEAKKSDTKGAIQKSPKLKINKNIRIFGVPIIFLSTMTTMEIIMITSDRV